MFLRALLASILTFATLSASAALMREVVGGRLVSATGVIVNGQAYSVRFEDGACTALFSGCNEASDFAFQSDSDAVSAALALMNTVLLDVPAGQFDTEPSLTRGCTSNSGCVALIPYRAGLPVFVIAAAFNNVDEPKDFSGFSSYAESVDTATSPFLTWAIFEPEAIHGVPEPTTLLSLLLGLLCMTRICPRRTARPGAA